MGKCPCRRRTGGRIATRKRAFERGAHNEDGCLSGPRVSTSASPRKSLIHSTRSCTSWLKIFVGFRNAKGGFRRRKARSNEQLTRKRARCSASRSFQRFRLENPLSKTRPRTTIAITNNFISSTTTKNEGAGFGASRSDLSLRKRGRAGAWRSALESWKRARSNGGGLRRIGRGSTEIPRHLFARRPLSRVRCRLNGAEPGGTAGRRRERAAVREARARACF